MYHFILGEVVLSDKKFYCKAGNIARKAAKSHKKEVKVAASIPPVLVLISLMFDSEKSLPILELFKNNLIQYCDLILTETYCIDEIETIQKVLEL